MRAPAILETRCLSCNRSDLLPCEHLDITLEPGQISLVEGINGIKRELGCFENLRPGRAMGIPMMPDLVEVLVQGSLCAHDEKEVASLSAEQKPGLAMARLPETKLIPWVLAAVVLEKEGIVLSLLVSPLYVHVLIFNTSVFDSTAIGLGVFAHLSFPFKLAKVQDHGCSATNVY
ncbi:MAG: hypothetical protein DRQ59_04615 [Gammaproteobacteria bacterium]|nr:MAG: hypothetical protein DRQ59_04615 [Gammaproteobacteria bacterium]